MIEEFDLNFLIEFNHSDESEQYFLEKTNLLKTEIKQLGVNSVEFRRKSIQPNGTKSVDPVVAGALIISLAPVLLTKFLEFLHAWAMRREEHSLKIKIQTSDGAVTELEVPTSMSLSETKKWVNATADIVMEIASSKNKKKKI